MSREIKFKAYSTLDGRHYDIQWIDFEFGMVSVVLQRNEFGARTLTETRPLSQLALRQYTGLKDKNGVEIYEGDILLNLPIKLFVDSEQSRRYGKVYWKNKDACFGLLTFRINDRLTDYDEPFPMTGIEKYEVIGNIYENPGLLDAKS